MWIASARHNEAAVAATPGKGDPQQEVIFRVRSEADVESGVENNVMVG
jgi:hypothetical protein